METHSYRGARITRSALLAIAGFVACMVLLPSHAFATTGSCFTSEGTEFCKYESNPLPKETRVYFEAAGGNNQRNWYENVAGDYYGGSVGKCAGVQTVGGGVERTCGTGNPIQGINAAWNPSFIFMFQYAEGPRNVYGEGLIP